MWWRIRAAEGKHVSVKAGDLWYHGKIVRTGKDVNGKDFFRLRTNTGYTETWDAGFHPGEVQELQVRSKSV